MHMNWISAAGLVLSILLLGYLALTCCFRRNSDMSANGWLQFAIYSVVLLATFVRWASI